MSAKFKFRGIFFFLKTRAHQQNGDVFLITRIVAKYILHNKFKKL